VGGGGEGGFGWLVGWLVGWLGGFEGMEEALNYAQWWVLVLVVLKLWVLLSMR
jgi:hypothetical protein